MGDASASPFSLEEVIMKYYKLLSDEFIGVVTSSDFVRENPNNGWLLTSNESLGQFVSFENKLYRDYWMQPIPNNTRAFTRVDIREITKEEYDILYEAIEHNEPVIIDDDDNDEPYVPEPIIEEPDEILEFVRTSKINEMSATCRHTIENGFDLELRGETHHFSLDTQDQLNLISLSAMAQTQEYIPYHADGESCIFYTAEEMGQIVATATSFKIYHTTYYNALKAYINSLDTIEAISAIEYGVAIPEEYQSDVLKALAQ